MPKVIKKGDLGKPKTLTLRLDQKAALQLDLLISESPESTYAALITSMIMERRMLLVRAETAQESCNQYRTELVELKSHLAELMGNMEFVLSKLRNYELVGKLKEPQLPQLNFGVEKRK